MPRHTSLLFVSSWALSLCACAAVHVTHLAPLPATARSIAVVGVTGYDPVRSDEPTRRCTAEARATGFRVVDQTALEKELQKKDALMVLDDGYRHLHEFVDVDLVLAGSLVAHRQGAAAVIDSIYLELIDARTGQTVRGATWDGSSDDPGGTVSAACQALFAGVGNAR